MQIQHRDLALAGAAGQYQDPDAGYDGPHMRAHTDPPSDKRSGKNYDVGL
jgi:hypothetical protein